MDLVVAVTTGFVAGVAAGVAGIGGGVVIVPALVFLLGFDQHTAEGTSLVAIVFSAMAGTRVHLGNARVDLRQGLILGAAGAVAAPVAAHLALTLDADTLQRFFGVLVVYAGSRMGWRSLRPSGGDDHPV